MVCTNARLIVTKPINFSVFGFRRILIAYIQKSAICCEIWTHFYKVVKV